MEEKRQRRGKFSPLLIILVIVIALGALVASKYNGLVNRQENVNKTWAEVQTQYQEEQTLYQT